MKKVMIIKLKELKQKLEQYDEETTMVSCNKILSQQLLIIDHRIGKKQFPHTDVIILNKKEE